VKKSLVAFAVAFALSVGFTFLPSVTRASLLVGLQSNAAELVSVDMLLDIFFSLAGLAVFFVVFYFLAKNSKITAVKSTIISILLGVILGSTISYPLSIFAYLPGSYLAMYFSMAAGSSVSGVFQFFLPALTGLLFAELREKRSNNSLTA